jgi:hypothetical protein
MPAPTPATSRRHRLRLSVRGLILLVLIVGAGLGWIVRSARVQRHAVAAIRRAGGRVVYDWEYSPVGIDAFARPRWREWLVDRVGEDYFGHVVKVEIAEIQIVPGYARTDDERKALRDAALAQVVRLSGVHILSIRHCRDRDAVLADLGRLNGLTELKLISAGITDFRFLRAMTSLEELDLFCATVDDAALAHLEKLTRLRSLTLACTDVTDAGLVHLKGLAGLVNLGLGDTKVTDAGLVHPTGLNRLQGLSLSDTKVTDAGLVRLKRMTGLRHLNLHGTNVTDAGVQSLQTALPMLSVFR